MKTLITGATGYIGEAVARAFRRAGHEVWGLCRSQEKALHLSREECHPLIGDITRPETYERVAEECSILVHAAADSGKVAAADRAALDTLFDAARRGPSPKTLVYTSGVWVYGNTGTSLVDETTPLRPAKLVAWRPENEQRVLSADLRGIVIRPGAVYGGRGGLTGLWFQGAREGVVRVIGDGKNRWAMVHVDDLADAYVRAAESGLKGEVFNVTDRSRNTVGEMALAAARVAGKRSSIEQIPLDEASKTMGDFAECLTLDQHVDGRKAVSRLGWQPRHGGFVDGVEAYFEAWRARQ
jgi:nucleoside-diphosphate-sugar epimerase